MADFEIRDGSILDSQLSNNPLQIKGKVDDLEQGLSATQSDITTIEGDIITINSTLDDIQGDVTVEGSIEKSLQDAKDYADSLVGGVAKTIIVQDITERNALTNVVIGNIVLVNDNENGKWALYTVTSVDPSITYLKVMDQGVMDNFINPPAVDAERMATATISSGGWSGTEAPYTQDVSVSALPPSESPILDLDLSSIAFSQVEDVEEAWGFIYRAAVSENTLTFYAKEVPTVNIPITIKIIK